MDVNKRYRAAGLARQQVYIAVDKALKKSGIRAESFLELAHSDDDATFPVIDTSVKGIQSKTFFSQMPAAAISSALLHKDSGRQVNSSARKLLSAIETKKLLPSLISSLENRMHANRNLFFGLSLEVLRMITDDDAMFSDNLMLEVADVVIDILPLGLALEQINPEGYKDVLSAARLAVEIRSQIVWGMVDDYDLFRNDVLAMAAHLQRLITTLNMSPTLLSRFDPDAMTEKLRAYLRQPLLQLYQ